MFKQTRLSLGLLVTFSLFCACYGGKKNLVDEIPVANVAKLLTKLEKFATQSHLDVCGLTIPEIAAAYNDFKLWDEATISTIRDHQPLIQALIDFLFRPMQQHPAILPLTSNPKDKKVQDLYIQRFEQAYKQLRPSYLGQVIGNYYRRAEKIDRLIDSLLQLDGAKPVTKRMIEEAIAEHDAYLTRSDDIKEYEDIYANLDEFKMTNNLLNRDEVRVLRDSIFPWKNNALTPENTSRLCKMYKLKLASSNYVVKDGILY